MDSSLNGHLVGMSSNSPRKRARENETQSQKQKREKAAARQRKKRERDRTAAGMSIMAFPQPPEHQIHQQQHQHPQHQDQHQQQQHEQHQEQQHPEPPAPPTPNFGGSDIDLSPEESVRRERVRAAARERQRKHRQLVKQRKMRELGMDMGNEIMPGMEEVHYRVGSDGQYQQVLPHELQHNPHAIGHEPPFPQGQPLGGQTFASTLLLSFSCAPLLKQHLLRTLNMTNEELASLEPIIADAWDHWDHQRRMHYAEHAAQAVKAAGPNMSAASAFSNVEMDHSGNPYATDPSQNSPNDDFRARFHRSLVAPSPFRNFNDAQQATATASGTSTSGSGPTSDPIDPHLTVPVPRTSESRQTNGLSSVDPDLGQARGEAEGVVGRLERG